MSVVLLADVKTHQNITTTANDTELQAFIDAAEAAIGKRVGPLATVARTVRVAPYPKALRVPSPAASLTSVTDYAGTAVTLTDLRLDSDAGLISYLDGRSMSGAWYDVTYAHGYATCPADLKLAVKEQVRHLWTTQRGGGAKRPGSGQADNVVPGSAHTLPYRVIELIDPYMPQLVG